MLLLTSSRFSDHVTPPGHPERPERAEVFDAVAAQWTGRTITTAEPRAAQHDEIARAHTVSHIDQIAHTAGRAVMLDADTFTSPESYEIALLAAGATIHAATHASETREPAFALVRPPGHHAERDRAMGFCLFNNVAVAAAVMLERGLQRIAIVDIDVHHGNGTEAIFYADPRVLYLSTHQYPFYPGTGAADDVGTGDGRGFTVNVPMEAGSNDGDYALVHRAIVAPILEAFRPELLLVSAGYDAHERDPLASMRMTANGYGAIVASLAASAARHGALALVTEGGYELSALAECLNASVTAVRAQENGETMTAGERVAPTRRGDHAVALARAAQTPFWRGL
jgi:acetoin utilization deacetylase AcuC-like enzyme